MGKTRPKLGSSTVLAVSTFRPSRRIWHRLSAAYGLRLTGHDARAIGRIIREYYRHIQWELSAPDVAGAVKRVANIHSAAINLWNTMLSQGGNHAKRTSASSLPLDHVLELSHAARGAIENHWIPATVQFEEDDFEDNLRPRLIGISKWMWMERELEMLAAACARGERELKEPGRACFRKGEAWDDFVCALTEWAEVRGYPKSVSIADSDRLPAFLSLMEQIQSEIAPQFRSHGHSSEALAIAIKRARHAREIARANSDRDKS